MPRNKYLKPLVFHDGRLAFLLMPCEMMAFFMWIPVAIPLAVFRIVMGIVFPYKISIFIAAVTGIRFRRAGDGKANGEKKGVLYVCTHRMLLDPVMLCSALERTVPAVTYNLSRVSEVLAPMRTVRLTRDRGRDAATMRRLLAVEGGLAVCPEGTTCREPYLLRFSPLFAEVAEEVVPVALDARVGMLLFFQHLQKRQQGSVVTTIVNLAEAKLAQEGVKAPSHVILSVYKSLVVEGVAGGV
ncbi:glycerol-3-phosphate acyltransferase 1-like [Zingiber officinale]|uniref:glycerol-3-phosphate acyltransferase 1-like n=1 Tax=Zingiber officinale TaxID=94328 RepID=UPI001C4B10BA|nr:glycerol-3-phosphate acyltransferase 1-like [Zingiber officinale]